jgi:hypothetical protein
VHHIPGAMVAAGAGLILVANVLVELFSSKAAKEEVPVVLD